MRDFYTRVQSVRIMEDKDKDKDKDIALQLKRLPEEVVLYIYKEFFEPDVYYQLYHRLVSKRDSIRLEIEYIRPFLPHILAKPHVVKYFSNKLITGNSYAYFESMYKRHKIEKRKYFSQMTQGDSLALSLLMCLYH